MVEMSAFMVDCQSFLRSRYLLDEQMQQTVPVQEGEMTFPNCRFYSDIVS